MINNQWIDVPEQETPSQQLIGICSVCGMEKPVCMVMTFSELKIGIGEKCHAVESSREYFCDGCLKLRIGL